MKKTILFLSVIGVTLLMTSCLGETTSNYTDYSYVYVDMDEMGQVYGKTFSYYSSSRVIASGDITASDLGTIKYIAYSWDETYGFTSIMLGGEYFSADNVQLLNQIDISHTSLVMQELPSEENPAGFDEIGAPLYSELESFMDDYWVFEYAYTAKEGQTAGVEFYKRDEENENGEIVIDIRLVLSGTAGESAADETNVDAVAVDMGALRAAHSADSEELNIRFNYYKDNGDETPEQVAFSESYEWDINAEE